MPLTAKYHLFTSRWTAISGGIFLFLGEFVNLNREGIVILGKIMYNEPYT
jgi:hypothetical protein